MKLTVIEIDVFKVGCGVLIGDAVKGTVTAVCIRDNFQVTYEVSWWYGNSHNVQWLHALEVKRDEASEMCRIGFRYSEQ